MPPQVLYSAKATDEYLKQIAAAQREICIFSFDWRRYKTKQYLAPERIFNALHEADNRGVDIRLIGETRFFHEAWRGSPIKTKKLRTSRLMHAKAWIFDRERVIIGSHNMTKRATSSNIELSVFLENKELAETLVEQFNWWWEF